ncbi:UNVERIFIED_ORG: hypothetical protein L601_000200001800 [Gordonia westfalica J30]
MTSKGIADQWLHHPTAHVGGRAPGVRYRRSRVTGALRMPTTADGPCAANALVNALVNRDGLAREPARVPWTPRRPAPDAAWFGALPSNRPEPSPHSVRDASRPRNGSPPGTMGCPDDATPTSVIPGGACPRRIRHRPAVRVVPTSL